MSSAFDDLLGLGDTSGNASQPSNPFDPIGTNQTGGSSGGDLLDLGFDAQISTQNGNSGKVSFEANTNPLYELSQNTMESEPSNPLFDFNAETQKEAKIETGGNPLYDFLQSENTNGTNGHYTEDVLTNGGTQHEVDLLGMTTDVPAGAVTSDDSGVTLDSHNLNESNPDPELEQELEPEPAQELESEPAQELESELAQEVEQEPEQKVEQQEPELFTMADTKEDDEEIAQERSRTNSEASEPEEQKQVDGPLQQNGTHLEDGTSDQPEGPVDVDQKTEPVKQETVNVEVEEAKPEGTVVEEDQTGPDPSEEGEPSSQEEPGKDTDDKQAANDDKEGDANQEAVDNEAVEVGKVGEQSTQEDEIVQAETEPEVQAAVPQVPQESENTAADSVEEEQADSEKIIPESKLEPEPEVLSAGPEAVADNVEQVSDEPKPDMAEPVQEDLPEQQDIAPAIEENVESAPPTEEPEKTEQPISDSAEVEHVAPEPVQAEQESAIQDEIQDPVPEPEPEQVQQEPAIQEEKQEPAPEPESNEQEPATQEEKQEIALEPEQVEQEQATQEEKQDPVPEPEQVEEVKPEEEAENTEPLEVAVETADVGNEEQKEPESQARETTEAVESEPAENGVAKVNGTSDVKENGLTEEEAIHFAEMNSFRQKFESGKIDDKEPEPKKKSVKEEYDDGGEFENEPVKNPDVVREADQATEDLPEAGTAKNLLDKFKSIQEEKAATVTSQKRESPPRQEKVEYESTPSERLVIETGKSDEGEFESTPSERLVIEAGKSETGEFESTPAQPEGVVRSGDVVEDAQPEKGYAKNILNKFKEIQSGAPAAQPREKREITPDRSGKVEYVSEPRGQKIEYDENRVDTGVYENQPTEEEEVVRSLDKTEEVMPESGMAKNLLSKFKQMESEIGNKPPPSPKREVREITPDRSGKVEYTSEPRGSKIEYEEQKEDQGIFESKPAISPEVVRSEDMIEDFKPEAGTAKKTLERYKEMQIQSSSPVSSTPRKEITPPRDTTSPGKTVHGVVENTPAAARDDVVRCEDTLQDELPEQGSAKTILNKFKEIQSSAGNSPADSPTKKIKEFTPPPEAGVYENTPTEHLIIEPQQSFEGVLESTPEKSKADVARDYEHSPEKELPETGLAKNLVSKFRQLETTSAKTSSSSSPRFKEFTPPRDRGPLSPKSPAGAPSEGVNLSDLPGQYQQYQDKPGIFENEPEVKADVYREADTDWQAGMPAPNTTSSILQRFKSIQDQAKEDQKTPAPVSRKEDSPPPQDSEAKNVQHE